MSTALKRLMIEHRDSKKRDAKRREKEQSSSAGGSAKDSKKEGRDIVLFPKSPDNLFDWTAFIDGPKDTPYEGGRFQLRLQIPNRYPLKPPIVHFVTKVCHPNVLFRTGEICLNILKDQWSPVCTLEMMCISIMNLLYAPEASSPLNCDAGNLIRSGDIRGFNSLARMYTAEYAMSHLDASGKTTKPKDAKALD